VTGADDRAGIPDAGLFVAYAEAIVSREFSAIAEARDVLAARLGPAAVVDATAVAALFNAINRVADAIGIKVEQSKADRTAYFRSALSLNQFQTARME
jgi:hypothetical protein